MTNKNEAKKPEAAQECGGSVDPLVMRCRTLAVDHEPDGWPAIKMRDVTALCDEIERLQHEVLVQSYWGPKFVEAHNEVIRLRVLRDVVTAYIAATGDVPGNNESWAQRFRDAYDAYDA